jgi:hypothetical protein
MHKGGEKEELRGIKNTKLGSFSKTCPLKTNIIYNTMSPIPSILESNIRGPIIWIRY